MEPRNQSPLQNGTPPPSRHGGPKKRRALWWYFLPFLVVGVAVIIFYVLSNWDSLTIRNATGGIEDDPNASAGEMQRQVDEKVESNKFRLQINKNPVFENGTASGDLKLINDPANRYTQTVTITLDETGEVLYKSGGVRPGMSIREFQLSRSLPKGVYQCTAKVRLYKDGSSTQTGSAGAKIKITVNN